MEKISIGTPKQIKYAEDIRAKRANELRELQEGYVAFAKSMVEMAAESGNTDFIEGARIALEKTEDTTDIKTLLNVIDARFWIRTQYMTTRNMLQQAEQNDALVRIVAPDNVIVNERISGEYISYRCRRIKVGKDWIKETAYAVAA